MTTLRLQSKFVAVLLSLPLVVFAACTPEVREYGGGGAGGSGSSSSGGSQCMYDADCGASSECQTFVCTNGTCSVSFSPMGTTVLSQALGDCQSNVCDGKGYVIAVPDDMDPTDDGNPCTTDTCANAMTQHAPEPAGNSCNGSRHCDGNGQCVECVTPSDCANGVCYQNTCTTPLCSDMVKNGAETDVDCGGPDCPQCPVGANCAADVDCKSHICQGGVCAAPTCTDNVQNGSETYIDCGGPDCPACPPGKPCTAGIDCDSKVCYVGVCQDAVCTDQVLNGTESDVDCGGSCPKCANGRACWKGTDCITNHCCPGDINMPGYCENMNTPCMLVLRSDSSQ